MPVVAPAQRTLPTGTVTFAFTDIEGSTRLLHDLGQERYADALAEHRRALRAAFGSYGGVEVDTQGDAFFYAFPSAQGAVDAAREGCRALAPGPIHVRVGIHTGTPHVTDEGYVGPDVHKGARIGAAGHGGQILLSLETRNIVDAEVTDLGEHRLKDFAEPVWIFQLGIERFPPLKTISNTNLPHPASSFIGREQEMEDVVSLLRESRLVTLTGPGGSGKTRLAIEAAAELVPENRNGVFWIGLMTLRDAAAVPEEIAKTLGAKDGLAEHIGEREMLLLLDNLEQVIDASPALGRLLETCPNLRLLITSRELLRIRGEVDYPVLPLADPEAVALFCARARVESDEVIAQLCRRLDNLPLAIELAAARTNVLAPTQILERLSGSLDLLKAGRDADPRQATLRATIEWSHDLLSNEEQELFARLAIFAGGCTLASAEAIVETDLDTMQSLLDKSLLRRTKDRFWMLETIREYAAGRLQESGEAGPLRRRHAEYFLALAEEAEPHLRLFSQIWIDKLEPEHDNLRAALDQFVASGETQFALRLAGSLTDFWFYAAHVAEARSRLERVLAADDRPTRARARALISAADIASVTGDIAMKRWTAEEALDLYRSFGDAWGVANAQWKLGVLLVNLGELNEAQRLLEAAVEAFDQLGDVHHAIAATRSLAWTYHERRDLETARRLHEANLGRAREAHFKEMEAITLGVLADIAVDQGRISDATDLVREALLGSRDLGDTNEVLTEVCRVAFVLVASNSPAIAARLLSGAEALREEMGTATSWITSMNQDTLELIRSQLDEDSLAEAWERGRSLTLEAAVELALDSLRERS
jgi:predicted ATPase/class 3 adenylate cyclase